MSPHESRVLWCFLDGDTMPYDIINIPIRGSVRRVKKSLTQRIVGLRDTNADHLKLWKPNGLIPIGPDHSLAQRLGALGKIATYSKQLSSEQQVGDLFPEPHSENYLHIVVQYLAPSSPSASRKCSRSAAAEDGQAVKRKETGELRLAFTSDVEEVSERQNKVGALHKAIKAMPNNLDLSNPSMFTSLPFPSLLSMPYQRFESKEINGVDHFEYMGRYQFHKLQKRVENKIFLKGPESLYLYGTSGSGKSHLLAALVYHLIREGKHVFYIPDCFSLLLAPAETMWAAYHFAFYGSPVLSTIGDPHNIDALIRLMAKDRDVYIIVDQVNTLEPTENDSCREEKVQALRWLRALRFNHRYIFSASADETSNREADRKQSGISFISIFGGMSLDETDQWFIHYDHKIPQLSAEQRQHVEHLTGSIPLLLRCLFNIATFVEHKFRNTPELCNLSLEVHKFGRTKLESLNSLSKQMYLKIMGECIRGDPVEHNDRSLYDLRHFYVDEKGIGHYTCGIAFETMTSMLRTYDDASFPDDLWYTAVLRSDNPLFKASWLSKSALATLPPMV